MVKFIEVNPADIPTERLGRRGRVSYPIVKGFLESGMKCAQLDMAGLEKNPQYLRSVLYSYIRSHDLPIKIFSANGDTHLLRLDMDDKGVVDPNWKPADQTTEGNAGLMRDLPAVPLNAEEVAKRFQQEKGQTAK